MEINIKATDQLTHLDGVPVRVWEGVTDIGIPCKVLVYGITMDMNADAAAFERDLKRQLPPGRVVSLREVL